MAIFKGNSGSVSIGGNTSCEIASWTCTINYDRPDMTPINSLWKQTGLGLSSGSGSVESYVWLGATSANFNISLIATNGKTITGVAQLTAATLSVPSDAIITYKYDFIFSGPVIIS